MNLIHCPSQKVGGFGFQDKTRNFEQKVKDLQDEIAMKEKQIEVLENEKSSTFICSKKSLKDELASVQIFSCKSCHKHA